MSTDRESPEQERQRRADEAYAFLHPPAGTVLHRDEPQDEKPPPKPSGEEHAERVKRAREELGLDKPAPTGKPDRWLLGAGDKAKQ